MDDGLATARSERLDDLQDLGLITNRLRSQGIKSSYIVRKGSAADLLVQVAAEQKPDLLLMGAYGFPHGEPQHPGIYGRSNCCAP